MPSSANRHRIEIPTALYDRLVQRAQRDGMTTSALAAALLAAALDEAAIPEGEGQPSDRQQLREVVDLVRHLVDAERERRQEAHAIHRQIAAQLQAIDRTLPLLTEAHRLAGPLSPPLSPAPLIDFGPPAAPQQTPPATDEARRHRAKALRALDDAMGRLSPPELGEYLRLLLVLSSTHSPQLKEEYGRQAETLWQRLEARLASEEPAGST